MNITTPRLKIRDLEIEDAQFMLELLNSKGFIEHIGDRGVREVSQAEDLIKTRYRSLYPTHGLFVVERATDNVSVGTVSLLKRDNLPFDDIGYAFLPQFFRQGYATEAVSAVISDQISKGADALHGVVDFDNIISQDLLIKLGFDEDGTVLMKGEEEPIKRFTRYFKPAND